MPSGFLVLLLLSGATPVGSDDCPAIVAATTSENVDRNPDAVRCLTSRMSQTVYEDTERCIELMIGVSDLRESLKGIERYSHLDNAKSDRIEASMRGEFARMRALPPLGVGGLTIWIYSRRRLKDLSEACLRLYQHRF